MSDATREHAAVDTFAVVTGGGTTGHVAPALAILEALDAAGHPIETLHYVGTQRGIETRLVPPTGVGHTFLSVGGLQRGFSWRDIRRNLAFVPMLWRSARAARRVLAGLAPAVVVNVGGYGSFPATHAAKRLGIPVVVVSYDLRPGLVSRWAARFAAVNAVAFAGSTLPRPVLTGAPVRQAFVQLDRAARRDAARAELGVPADRFLVAVMAGSLGSRLINDVVTGFVDRHRSDASLAVRHVVGDRFLGEAAQPLDDPDGIMYQVIGYEERMDLVYAAADLLVTRAGASTMAELATVGAPAIVVPWSGAADDHQTANARMLGDAGGAIVLAESDLTVDALESQVQRLRDHPAELAALGSRARMLGDIHRSGKLVDVICAAASSRAGSAPAGSASGGSDGDRR